MQSEKLTLVSINVVMTWARDHTQGSVLIAALIHAAMNTAWAVLNVVWGMFCRFWLCAAFEVAMAIVVSKQSAPNSTQQF
jgi:uncharacterized membrane protein YccF (DUF307 family)